VSYDARASCPTAPLSAALTAWSWAPRTTRSSRPTTASVTRLAFGLSMRELRARRPDSMDEGHPQLGRAQPEPDD